NTRWQYTSERPMPWGYASAAEYDPKSGMVVLIGGRGTWIYDPKTHDVVASLARSDRSPPSSNLLLFPPNANLYLFDPKTAEVREVVLDRKDWNATTERLIETSGDKPGAMRNFAYDAKNRIIGGIK